MSTQKTDTPASQPPAETKEGASPELGLESGSGLFFWLRASVTLMCDSRERRVDALSWMYGATSGAALMLMLWCMTGGSRWLIAPAFAALFASRYWWAWIEPKQTTVNAVTIAAPRIAKWLKRDDQNTPHEPRP